jgi:streptogramin lyase
MLSRQRLNPARILAVLAIGFAVGGSGHGQDAIQEFPLSSDGHRPQAVALGADGNLWVTEVLKHKILKILRKERLPSTLCLEQKSVSCRESRSDPTATCSSRLGRKTPFVA